jgi:hypothetical protein
MADATIAQGTELRMQDPTASPLTYDAIPGLQSMTPTKSNTLTPIQDLSSDHEEDIMTMQGGTLSITINWLPDNDVHQRLEAAAADGGRYNFRVAYTQDSPELVYGFAAVVASEADTPALGGVIQRTYELKLQSRPTEVA